MKDYYKVLGLPYSATPAQIKRAYRNLIKACHPDVNPSPQAADWTRQLNEAYDTLSDTQRKLSYDMDFRVEESRHRETAARQTAAPPPPHPESRTSAETGTAAGPSPEAEPIYSCERCERLDSTLRISATWRVYSFINYSRKTPTVKILCGRCRVKESLAASAMTLLLGWWSPLGFFWTLDALASNALGGEQPRENNAALLKAVGYELYRSGRYGEAQEALRCAFTLQPDPKAEEAFKNFRHYFSPAQKRSFWRRFRNLELHPLYYHGLAGAALLALLFLAINAPHSK
jgi:curved DNA-binding protein CbpA